MPTEDFVFEIPDFWTRRSKAATAKGTYYKTVASRAFGTNVEFRIRVHPNGTIGANGKTVSAFLEVAEDNLHEVWTLPGVTFSLSLLHHSNVAKTVRREDSNFTYSAGNMHRGWHDIIPISDLHAGWFGPNDTLAFKATVTYEVSKDHLEGMLKPEALAQRHLKSALQSLLSSQWHSDYVLVAGKEEIPVHSIILGARSPVFKAMLESSMTEGSVGKVHIPDVPPDALRSLRHFIYTGTLPEKACQSDDDTHALLMAATKYDIPSLLHLCSSRAKEHVTIESVAQWLSAATKANIETLKSHCLTFASEHLAEVQTTDGWDQLVLDKHLFSEVAQLLFQTVAPPAKKPRCSAHDAG